MVNPTITAITESSFIRWTKHRCLFFVTHITHNLHSQFFFLFATNKERTGNNNSSTRRKLTKILWAYGLKLGIAVSKFINSFWLTETSGEKISKDSEKEEASWYSWSNILIVWERDLIRDRGSFHFLIWDLPWSDLWHLFPFWAKYY